MSDQQNEMIAGFCGGASFGVAGGLTLFPLDMTGFIFPLEFALKIFGTIMLASIGGIFGMLARDIYTYYLKPKIKKFNPKKDGTDNIQPEQHQETRP